MMATLGALGLSAALGLSPATMDATVHQTEGATIRLVAERDPSDGDVRAAVIFDLEPGWKTYWADPGEAGLAPSFEIAGRTDVEPLFPLPVRFDEAGYVANGYTAPAAVAFRLREPLADDLTMRLFVGLCREICVPVTAELRLDLAEPLDPNEATALERAFLALPVEDPSPLPAQIVDDRITIAADAAPEAVDVFLRGSQDWHFGPATRDGEEWQIPIRSRPREAEPHLTTVEAVIAVGPAGRRRTVILRN